MHLYKDFELVVHAFRIHSFTTAANTINQCTIHSGIVFWLTTIIMSTVECMSNSDCKGCVNECECPKPSDQYRATMFDFYRITSSKRIPSIVSCAASQAQAEFTIQIQKNLCHHKLVQYSRRAGLVRFRQSRFEKHKFWCGASPSDKTVWISTKTSSPSSMSSAFTLSPGQRRRHITSSGVVLRFRTTIMRTVEYVSNFGCRGRKRVSSQSHLPSLIDSDSSP